MRPRGTPRPIKRLLIANRGEIAVRIVKACRELGIETVAVCSEIDRQAPHVAAADRAVTIGPAPARDSYLSIPRILEAARTSGADAIHPGYGFLSEDADFAEACEQARITFVGPPAGVLARMGSKIEARRLMDAAGVPVVPGGTPDDQSDDSLSAAIARIGVPVLIKASAGGGGRGMRLVRDPRDGVEAIQAARREAEAAFGDGTLYIERFLEGARHIEVQIVGDAHGQVVHLFERDCSVQRRHQKIIEESPSPKLDPVLRSAMTDSAVAAGRAAGYRNAGTVEFLVERSAQHAPDARDARYYFLEMNARLQVEHPVTEEITGLDLVRAQLVVAAGEPLPWSQAAIERRGHAIEARVYAEDPAHDFIPQAGRLLLYREPCAPGVRIDSGVIEGSDVPIHYDPLLAKVIARAESRESAIGRLVAALRDFPILGVRTNLAFLIRLLEDTRFRAGEIDTSLVDAGSFKVGPDEIPPFVRAAMWNDEDLDGSAGPGNVANGAGRDPWQTLRGWRG